MKNVCRIYEYIYTNTGILNIGVLKSFWLITFCDLCCSQFLSSASLTPSLLNLLFINISFENSISFLSGFSYFPEQSHPSHTLLFILKIFIYFWLGLHCCVGFSPVAVSRGYSLVAMHRFSLCGLLLLWRTGSRACRLQELPHTGSGVAAPGL